MQVGVHTGFENRNTTELVEFGGMSVVVERTCNQDVEVRRQGVLLKQRYLPLNRVGCCVPGGAAAYPSTVLMTAVPAMAAGVDSELRDMDWIVSLIDARQDVPKLRGPYKKK